MLTAQRWHFITHICRFQNPGTYCKFNVATYPIFLILSKDGVIRGFHNVCRHRGFPVVLKDTGSSAVIGCGYHGWSYNSKGELVKAFLLPYRLMSRLLRLTLSPNSTKRRRVSSRCTSTSARKD